MPKRYFFLLVLLVLSFCIFPQAVHKSAPLTEQRLQKIDEPGSGDVGKFSILNYPEGADIWVDGELLLPSITPPLLLPLGERSLLIWKQGYAPLNATVQVSDNDSAFIRWRPKASLGTHARNWGLVSLGSLLGCVGILSAVGTIDIDVIKEDHKEMGTAAYLLAHSCLMSGLIAVFQWKGYLSQVKEYEILKGEQIK